MSNGYKGCAYGPEYFSNVMSDVSKFLPEIVSNELPDWVLNEGCVEIWSDTFKDELRSEFKKIARMIENRCEFHFARLHDESAS
jgi:hypothetical protein